MGVKDIHIYIPIHIHIYIYTYRYALWSLLQGRSQEKVEQRELDLGVPKFECASSKLQNASMPRKNSVAAKELSLKLP